MDFNPSLDFRLICYIRSLLPLLNWILTLADFLLSPFAAIAETDCSKTVPLEPELVPVVDRGSCETFVDWATRVEF